LKERICNLIEQQGDMMLASLKVEKGGLKEGKVALGILWQGPKRKNRERAFERGGNHRLRAF